MTIDSPEQRETLYRIFRDHQVGLCVNSAAHDINNLLGAILSYTELIEISGQPAAETSRMMGQIANAARRCSAIIESITDVARKERLETSILNIGELVEAALDLCRNDFRKAQVGLVFDNTVASRELAVRPQSLKLALLYLLTNAREAVSGTETAKVRVTAASREGSISISVWNLGSAMPDTDRERMFEPFFSTKGPGHLGLGLTLARIIAREHGGDLTYREGDGFVLELRT